MPKMRISEVAELLAVSDDTVRRWVDSGRLGATSDPSGRLVIDGADLAAMLVAASTTDDGARARSSARNRFTGIVTRVVRDTVMAQVEIHAGASRIVSLISRESADELGLEPGLVVTASIKSTNVVVERA
ncbi:MAG: binding domain protein excisionase family [Frankiales bacterium]|nr:binding domain protein excisionase family [Frankiales bacterium]